MNLKMHGGVRESDLVTYGRRMKYVLCSVCKNPVRSSKLAAHMRSIHHRRLETNRGRGRGGTREEALLICLKGVDHNRPVYLNLSESNARERRDFIREHRGHIPSHYQLSRTDQKVIQDLFKKEFTNSLDTTLREIFGSTPDTNSIPS